MTKTTEKFPGFSGGHANSVAWIFLSGTLLFGCGPSTPQLRATAANEMNCPVSELELEHIDSKSMAVIGCGREKVYSKYCDQTADGKQCGWRAAPDETTAQ